MNQPKNFHSAKLSLFQSITKDFLQQKNEVGLGLWADHPVMQNAGDMLEKVEKPGGIFGWLGRLVDRILKLFRRKSTIDICAELALDYFNAKLTKNDQRVEEIQSQFKFSDCDPGWLEAVEEYVKNYWLEDKKPTYNGYGDDIGKYVYPLPQGRAPGELTVGILGDWGTGESVAKIVLDDLIKQKPDLIIHVGDIYYSGTDHEDDVNFESLLNEARMVYPVPIYNLPGNHDYYSGGEPFYKLLSQLNRPPSAPPDTPIQEASYFCLRNEHWQLQGMDTGYNDHDVFKAGEDITRLHESEAKWHLDKINSAEDRRIILFSHHQLFSAFEKIGDQSANAYLLEDFGKPLADGRIDAWFWGHEHLLEVYAPFLGLKIGRCIGHSAFPEFVASNAYKIVNADVPLLQEDPGKIVKLGTTEDVFNHGYALMKLNENKANVNYYEIAGDGSSTESSLLFEETF